MDNVLFYGERDEHTRRQVRSAAAAHSHRIGPRKPKTAGKQSNGTSKGETTTTRRRTAPKEGSKSDSVTGTTVSSTEETVFRSMPPMTAPVEHPMRQQGWHQVQIAGISGQSHVRPHSASQSQTPPEQSKAGIVSLGLRDNSPAHQSTSSETQRLPAYSWTEYPRYGLGSSRLQSLEMLADVASSARTTPRSSSPGGGVPEFRLFKSSVEERTALPPLPTPPPTSSPSQVDNGCVSTDTAIKSEVVEMAQPHASRVPCAEFVPHPSRAPHLHSISPG